MQTATQGTAIDTNAASVGVATKHFFGFPGSMSWWHFLGVVFILYVIARAWAHHVNSIAT